MASSIFFAGRQWSTPGVMTQVDDSAMIPTLPTSGNNVVVVGESDGGAPNMLLTFASPADAANQLISGELLEAVNKAFAPSNEAGSPAVVYGMRVGQPTQASLMLKDASANNVVELLSTQYGLLANLTKVMVQAGTVNGMELSVAYSTNAAVVQDNIARNAMIVSYAGVQASAKITVANEVITLYAPTGTVAGTVDLTVNQTVDQAADAISAVPGFEATVVAGSGNTPALNGLDSVALQDVYAGPFTITANLQAFVDYINGNGQGLVTAVRQAGAGAVPAPIGWTYLSGATYPAPLTSDWSNAFTALQKENVQWLAILSPDPAIWAMADAHVQFMSTAGQKERRCFIGSDVGTNEATAEGEPLLINSDRTSYIWPGYYDYDANGNWTLFAPYMATAMLAGGFAAMNPGQTMTNKTITARGLEVKVARPADTDPLIQSGVLILEQQPEGFIVTRAISTWLDNNAYDKVEVSTGAALDYVCQVVRAALKPVVGNTDGAAALSRAISLAETALNGLAKPPPNGPGVIVGDANSPPWRNLTATLTGDVIAVSFECSPGIPANFIPTVVSAVPYSGTATVSGPTNPTGSLSIAT